MAEVHPGHKLTGPKEEEEKKEEGSYFDADIDIDIFFNCNWVDTRWQ
jgi:hypothetical protein